METQPNHLSLHFSRSIDRPWFQVRISLDKAPGGSLIFSWDCGIPLLTKWEQAQRRKEPRVGLKMRHGDSRINFEHDTGKSTLRSLPDGLSARR